MTERTKNLEKTLDERAAKEADKLRAVLTELQRTIETELQREEHPQLRLDLTGGSADERDQRERDLAALRRRLAEIPAEIERESEHLRSRYHHPRARLFPVAVTYLIPRAAVPEILGGAP